MSNLFHLLPDEIVEFILNYLTDPSDILKVRKFPGLFHHFNLRFWKKKVFELWGVPEWYFDLPIRNGRKLAPWERFLEIASKFELIPESIARIEEGRVEGVYDLGSVVHLAKKQRNERMGKILSLTLKPISEREKLFKLAMWKHCRRGRLRWLEYDKFSSIWDRVVPMIEKAEFYAIDRQFPSSALLPVLAVSASIATENSFYLLEKYFSKLGPKQKLVVMHFSILSRNFEQFVALYEIARTPPLSRQFDKGRNHLLEKAYYLANQPIIDFLEENKIGVEDETKIYSLVKGYLSFPRPVEVYQILESFFNKGGKICNYHFTSYLVINYLKSDADLFFLFCGSDTGEKLYRKIEIRLRLKSFSVGNIRSSIQILKENDQIQMLKESCSKEIPEICLKIFEEFGISKDN